MKIQMSVLSRVQASVSESKMAGLGEEGMDNPGVQYIAELLLKYPYQMVDDGDDLVEGGRGLHLTTIGGLV